MANPIDPSLLQRKVQGLMLLRVIVITLLLGATVVLSLDKLSSLAAPSRVLLYGLIVISYLLTILWAILLHRTSIRWLIWFQICWDLLLAFSLVLITGASNGLFTFFFPLAVINATILLYRSGALVTVSMSSTLYLISLVMETKGMIPSHLRLMQTDVIPSGQELILTAFMNIAAFYLISILASYLSEQLRSTNLKLREKQTRLDRLEALTESILQSISSGVITSDADGSIIYYNRSAAEILGLDPLGQSVEQVLSLREASAMAGEDQWEIRRLAGEGAERTLAVSQCELRDRSMNTNKSIYVIRDITELRAMEEVARRSERLAAIGKLAAGIAHEIRNPLASISGSIQLLRNELAEGDDGLRLMNIVIRETDRLNALITDFLGYARPRPLTKERLDIVVLLGEIIEIMRAEPGMEDVEISLDGKGVMPLLGDAQQLKQLFWNLLRNAVESMEGRGGRVAVCAEEGGGVSWVSITDDGQGIPEECADKIFDPFFTTKPTGTGLGLAMVHRIVEDHGGRIQVTSRVNKGTSFKIILPCPLSVAG